MPCSECQENVTLFPFIEIQYWTTGIGQVDKWTELAKQYHAGHPLHADVL